MQSISGHCIILSALKFLILIYHRSQKLYYPRKTQDLTQLKIFKVNIMIAPENQDTYHKNDNMYHMGEESIQSETMEHTDPAVNQHYDVERSADQQPNELDHDDADRRTLDDSEADEDNED